MTTTMNAYKWKKYSKPDHYWINALDDEGEENEFPNITDYFFSLDVSSLIFAMQDLSDKVR